MIVRLLRRLSETNEFHKYQSGFSDDRSTSSNLVILQALMRMAKRSSKPFFEISLDLRKAFDSVSHAAIFAALDARGVPSRTQEVIREIYTNASTTYWSGGITDDIRVPANRGIKQGDPLSRFL